MAGRKQNLKALFTNTRSRLIIIVTMAILVTAVLIGLVKFISSTSSQINSNANLSSTPAGIRSIPGSLNPTSQYASLQATQNEEQALRAQKTGTSAIPTIIRSQAFGDGVQSVGPQQGTGGVGFETLAMENDQGPQQSLWLQTLKDSNCSKASVQSVVGQGASLSDLKKMCTCTQLKNNDYSLSDLKKVCSCPDLKSAGFNGHQMQEAGFTAASLRECGFSACELKGAGFTAQELKDGGFTDGELKGAGFPDQDIGSAAGLPQGLTADAIHQAGCSEQALRNLREKGVSAATIRQMNGCSAAQLRAAGFSAKDLKDAGFSAADLKKAGFTPAELKQAGFGARDLLNAGFTPNDLADAGFSPNDIKNAENSLPPGMNLNDIKNAGCDIEALKRQQLAGVSAAMIRRVAGCSPQALRAAGFSDKDLANAGFTPADIAALEPSINEDAVRAAGCDPNQLKILHQRGVSAKRIHELNGCSAQALKAAGFNAADLAKAGFTPDQLSAAGFTPQEIAAAQLADDAIRAAGCNPIQLKKLRDQGISAKRIHDLNGCSAAQLKAAGFDARDLQAAGFTPEQLRTAGFTPEEIGALSAPNDAAIRAAGCDPVKLKELRLQGVSAKRIHDINGCSAAQLKAAGFGAKDLANAGFTPQQLLEAGFSPDDLTKAGLNPVGVIAAGRTADCSVASLKAAHALGVSALTIKNTLGCDAAAMKAAGYTAGELKAAGFTAAELKNAGFSPEELKNAGFSARELKAAGLSAQQLKAAGFKGDELHNTGFSDDDLKNAGFSPQEFGVPSIPTVTIPVATSTVTGIPSIVAPPKAELSNAKELQAILKRQQAQMSDQRSQQKLQQRTSVMLATATQYLQEWKVAPVQVYIASSKEEKSPSSRVMSVRETREEGSFSRAAVLGAPSQKALIKTGDVVFAVLDTSINSDEPGPILATIVSGQLKGSKLIGSFTLPGNAEKMVISFNVLSVPGAAKSIPISAYAIDPNTARTALSSSTNHHYLMRYGSLFAATFLEGFGNAFQSANTTITIGGTGGVTNTTVESGIGRSILENAVIGLATLGKNWGQLAQVQFSRPITVEVCSGTGIGILFTQDISAQYFTS